MHKIYNLHKLACKGNKKNAQIQEKRIKVHFLVSFYCIITKELSPKRLNPFVIIPIRFYFQARIIRSNLSQGVR